MFEGLTARAAARAERRARARTTALADALRETLPRGIEVASDDAGVHLSGRGLSRRFALDARLRWTILGLIK
jgi:DNA-binding transcriptional MocR family regulator